MSEKFNDDKYLDANGEGLKNTLKKLRINLNEEINLEELFPDNKQNNNPLDMVNNNKENEAKKNKKEKQNKDVR